MIAGILVYFLNFFTGKSKNQRLANAWFSAHKALLDSNFALVGDDGSKDVDDIETHLQKDSENIFTLWCIFVNLKWLPAGAWKPQNQSQGGQVQPQTVF